MARAPLLALMLFELGCRGGFRCFRGAIQVREAHDFFELYDSKAHCRSAQMDTNKVQWLQGGLYCALLFKFLQSGVLMAGSSRTTFAKRQKERARQEKQAEKAQRKQQRKQQDQQPDQDVTAAEKPKDLTITLDEEGLPQGFGFHDF